MNKPTLTVLEGPDYGHDDDGWERNRYKVRLRYQGRTMTTHYHVGLAHTDPPTAGDVIGSMVMDATGASGSFEEWCSDLGYDSDSRRAEATFRAVKKQTANLERLLGPDLLNTILEDYADYEEITYGSEERFAAGFARAARAVA